MVVRLYLVGNEAVHVLNCSDISSGKKRNYDM